ncbi:MAG: polysaccharide biosynthesis/export family protein [Oscillospiraceae bacterium]|jgi:hypothetical protein|nr:polysaccharide biosynthesis/export family protein [Oscillospiraceae bacterium]
MKKVRQIVLTLAIITAMIIAFIPSVVADEDLAEFELLFMNRIDNDTQAGWADNDNADWESVPLIGLTADILYASEYLVIEVENEPKGDFSFSIAGTANSWALTSARVDFSKDVVYNDGIITIPLTGSNTTPFMQEFRDNPQTGFWIVFMYYDSEGELQTLEDLGITNSYLQYNPSNMKAFSLEFFNRVFWPWEMAWADQDNAVWEEVPPIGLTPPILAAASELRINVNTEPSLDTISVTIFGNHNSWVFDEFVTEYEIANVYKDGVITIPLVGDNAPGYMENLRADTSRTGFCFAVIYGDEDNGIAIADLEISTAWFVMPAHSGDSSDDPLPPDNTPPPPSQDPDDDPSQTPGDDSTPTATAAPSSDNDGMSWWIWLIIVCCVAIAIAIVVVIIIKKK